MENPEEPSGELVLRTLAMPADTNPNGDIFGGWAMSQMDIAGGILAKEISGGRIVTVAVEGMKFIKPIQVGDVVCCYGQVEKVGNTSISLKLEVWVKPVTRSTGGNRFKVTEARFIYVAIDDQHNKRMIHK
ncbi:acyl-CoA thioester hydrolase YciA [uncultured Desulfuromonas sp.]|uniref:acyl-CoA thioester hydrolase YciA n=1 Tax=uncultured Desulfuromonas sp. TaxID=181013 RepID=UPI0026124C35|nr:acyl-CoA thioester hydrolase YciA [uncultured Desulfuromonas sp.]